VRIDQIWLKSGELKLAGEVYFPPGNKLCPALCICHGIPNVPYNPAERGYAILAQRFCAAGFITLIFNFRGTGRSEGNFDLLGWSEDLTAALDFLHSLERADKTHLCLLGFSGGAGVCVYAAAHDARVSVLAICACPADYSFVEDRTNISGHIERLRSIGAIRDKDFPPSIEKWRQGFETILPIRWIDKISPRPLLLVHGDADEMVPVEQAHKLYRKAKEPKDIAIIPGAQHRLRLEEAAMATVLDWLKAHSPRCYQEH
jgi:dipeptidyl aminopeptidase/acylaminoacyl peptidase